MISVCASAHSVETGRYEQVCTRADFPRTGKVPQALPLSQLGVVNLVHLIEHCRPQNPCELHWNLDQALYSRNACLWWCLCVCVYALRIVSMDKIVNLVHLIEQCRPQNLCELHWIKLCIVTMLVCVWGGGCLCVCVCACVHVHT